jgi:hypothetical protein
MILSSPAFRLGCTLALALAFAAPARAEEPTLEQMEEAREEYRAGSESYQKGNYPDAEKRFRHVYELLHSASLLYDLALALEKQSKWRAAADTYEAYLHDTRDVKDRKKLEKHVAEIRVRAVRADELAAMTRPKVREQGAPTEPGNQVLPAPAQTEEPLMGFGAAQGREAPPPQTDKKTRWWVWAVVGGAALVAIAVGVGVGVAVSKPAPESTTLPDFGPGALSVRF